MWGATETVFVTSQSTQPSQLTQGELDASALRCCKVWFACVTMHASSWQAHCAALTGVTTMIIARSWHAHCAANVRCAKMGDDAGVQHERQVGSMRIALLVKLERIPATRGRPIPHRPSPPKKHQMVLTFDLVQGGRAAVCKQGPP